MRNGEWGVRNGECGVGGGRTDDGLEGPPIAGVFAAGDEAACTRLVADHQRMVYQLALHLLGDPQEALDLSQEVFLRVFRTVQLSWDPGFGGWPVPPGLK